MPDSKSADRDQGSRVLHVAATSRPYTNGYTMRLQSIVETRRAAGDHVEVLTSPFYPGRVPAEEIGEWNGIPHHRCLHPIERGKSSGLTARLLRLRGRGGAISAIATVLEEELLMRDMRRRIVDVARRMDADLIHVHTPYRCARPALVAGRKLKIPVVYEVRGNWEDTAVSDGLLTDGGLGYRYVRWREGRVMRAADVVIGLCEQLAHEVRSRGVAADRVFVTPNGADLERLATSDGSTAPELQELRDDLAGAPVLGYVGSLRPLEGVDLLLEAISKLRESGQAVRGLIVGGGPDLEPLRAKARELGLGEAVRFPGPVPSQIVGAYYDLIDLFVVSRPDTRVTRMVTPIKPLEAMGRGKAVLMSDLPSLRELGDSAEAAIYFKVGDSADLADSCRRLLDDPAQARELGERAQSFVESERTWSATLSVLPRAYERARERR